ncbi:hypothetical protein [Endozoicomonas ascidiicola]|uniref:hypothetical protein n=1 Tax=Endozoicomonas ascidiicola TaxID=1698521 RepID=UPI00082B7369|nr:hypothetical protein [Endozoicomonas ascidiicola]
MYRNQWPDVTGMGGRMPPEYPADDSVLDFQREHDAKVFLSELGKRLGLFGLSLHEDKTRLIRFGRFARVDSKKREKGKPETFTFLGFTHICGMSRSSGNFNIARRTSKERMRVTLRKGRGTGKLTISNPRANAWCGIFWCSW